MYVEPNSTVRLLKGVPLDSDYNDTIYFSNRDAQYNYFINKTGVTLGAQTYQRVDRGIFRCSAPMSQVCDCNYMMFRNTSYENKWFYAFVTKVEYQNNGMCYVYFTIDSIQTWLFNGSMQNALGPCFVERSIVRDDTIGRHVEPENIPVGEYTYNNRLNYLDFTIGVMKFVVMAVDVDGSPDGSEYDHTYSGAKFYACNGESDVNKVLNMKEYKNKPDSIVGLYTVPTYAINTSDIKADLTVKTATNAPYRDYTLASVTAAGNTVDGYRPKNNKLFTYPYNFLEILTGEGDTAVYPYEYFTDLTPKFRVMFNMMPPVSTVLEPIGYKNLTGAYDPTSGYVTSDSSDPSNKVILTGYPMCSWNYDAYAVWQVQEGAVNQVNTGSSLVLGALDIATGAGAVASGDTRGVSEISSGVKSMFNSVKDNMNASYLASFKADVARGNLSSGSNNMAHQRMQFYSTRASVRANRAKQIDDFFSMFGYAIACIDTPNISSRPEWNYVKATDVNITAYMPTDDRDKIKSIFANGIRFWKNGDHVGNYGLSNK